MHLSGAWCKSTAGALHLHTRTLPWLVHNIREEWSTICILKGLKGVPSTSLILAAFNTSEVDANRRETRNHHRKDQCRRSKVQDNIACNQETLVLLDEGCFQKRWPMWVWCREENHHKVEFILWVPVSKNRIVPSFSSIVCNSKLKGHWLVVREQAFKCAACML